MDANMLTGLLFIIIAGTFSGTFSVPFKLNKGWVWENNWFIWSITALLVMPWIVALITIPNLFSIYQGEYQNLLLVILFGLIWGFGSILFGKGIDTLGISLSMPIMLGLINSVGTIMPIALQNPSDLLTSSGLKIIAGVAVIVIGIIFYSIAGSRKEKEQQAKSKSAGQLPVRNIKKGLIICLLAGVFGPMINFAFVYGKPIQEQAIEQGASVVFSANAIWCIVLTAGLLINALECVRLFKKNGSWKNYKIGSRSGILLAIVSGLIWYFSIMFYGMGGSSMGEMGASVGWATMQSLGIVAGNLAGVVTGEWKNISSNAIKPMVLGLVLLVAGVIIIAY